MKLTIDGTEIQAREGVGTRRRPGKPEYLFHIYVNILIWKQLEAVGCAL